MSTPMARKQEMVERQSAPFRKLEISVVPRARAPNMMLRWEMDLSPGTFRRPLRGDADENFIVMGSFLPFRYGISVYLYSARRFQAA